MSLGDKGFGKNRSAEHTNTRKDPVRDFPEVKKEVSTAFSQPQEKDNLISQKARKFKDGNTKISQLTEEKGHMSDKLGQLRAQNEIKNVKYYFQGMEKNKRKNMGDDLCEKRMEIRALSDKLHFIRGEEQKLKDNIEEVRKELNDMKGKESKRRHDNTCLEDENALLKRQKEEMALNFQKVKVQHSVSRRQADTSACRVRDLEQSLKETKEKTEHLKKEIERIKEENHYLKQQKSTMKIQHTSSIGRLEAEKAALQASSETRINMLQRDMEKLRQQHIADLRRQREMHMSEKEEMQKKQERFLHILKDELQVEREALRTMVQQMAYIHTVINQMLHAAFATRLRRQQEQQQYRHAAIIREMEDDS